MEIIEPRKRNATHQIIIRDAKTYKSTVFSVKFAGKIGNLKKELIKACEKI